MAFFASNINWEYWNENAVGVKMCLCNFSKENFCYENAWIKVNSEKYRFFEVERSYIDKFAWN